MPFQQSKNFRSVPRGVAEFKRIPLIFRKRPRKDREPLEVQRPMRRQLKQDRAKFPFQQFDPREVLFERRFRVLPTVSKYCV